MPSQKEIFKRLKQALNIEQDKELADFLGISASSFAVTKKRGTIPWRKIVEKSIGNYNLEYILFGKTPSVEIPDDTKEIVELFGYMPPKMKEELKEKLLKFKEFQESL